MTRRILAVAALAAVLLTGGPQPSQAVTRTDGAMEVRWFGDYSPDMQVQVPAAYFISMGGRADLVLTSGLPAVLSCGTTATSYGNVLQEQSIGTVHMGCVDTGIEVLCE